MKNMKIEALNEEELMNVNGAGIISDLVEKIFPNLIPNLTPKFQPVEVKPMPSTPFTTTTKRIPPQCR